MKFYKDAFGWEYITQPSTCPENTQPQFMMFQKGKTHGSFKRVEQLHHLSPAMHPDNADKQKVTITVTITTDNMEESMKAVENAGGSVYM
jgi:predicted enzyme related to lactoylglutathione lyase